MKGFIQASTLLPLLACGFRTVAAFAHEFRPRLQMLDVKTVASDLTGNGTFNQLIDHKNPEAGTFAQRIWWNATFWGGPGYPIVLFNPGEGDAAPYVGYLTDRAISGAHAKAIQAAVVIVEHRDYGVSAPSKFQDTKALQYLTLENSVQDMVHLARTLKLPFDTSGASNAPQTPWVFVGGSYTGALAAWIQKLAPGTFWAYHSSSAPVQAIYNFWQYFVPIQQGMPKNCSRDFERIMGYVDRVLTTGTKADKRDLKSMFGLSGLSHDDDFAGAIMTPLGQWQATSVITGYGAFYQMCDFIEGFGVDSPFIQFRPKDDGIGEWEAVNNYAEFFISRFLPRFCGQNYQYAEWRVVGAIGCFDSYNTTNPFYTDWSPANTAPRAWWWQLCNEPLAYWQTGTVPEGRPSIVSRLVTPEYYQRQCQLFFPKHGNLTFGSDTGLTAEKLNVLTGGWELPAAKRIVWINGEFDPWRAASVSSEFRPGGPLQSTEDAPVYVIPGATHCQDLQIRNNVNAGVRMVQEAAIKHIKGWVDEFYRLNGKPGVIKTSRVGGAVQKRWWDARTG